MDQCMLFERISDGVLAMDKDLVVLSVNPAGERLLGLSASELVGKGLFDVFPDARGSEFDLNYRGAILAQRPASFEAYYDGRGPAGWYDVHVYPLGDQGIAVLFADITERKEAEERLRRDEAHYRSLVERPDVAFMRVRPDGNYLYVSPQIQLITGIESEEFIKRGDVVLPEILHPDDRQRVFETMLASRRESGAEALDVEFRLRHKDGTYRWIKERQQPILSDVGELMYYDLIVEDVTERRALEEQLRHAQKMQAVGTLAGGLAHDFNNLLTAVLGNVSLLMEDIGPDHPYAKRLEAVERAASRAASLTQQLLSFTRKQKPIRKVIHMCDPVRESLTLLQRTLDPRIRLDLGVPESDANVAADPGQLTQVFMNLCVNARDAMPEGGTLKLRCERVDLDEAAARSHPDARPGRFIRISVEDTGIGMGPDVLARVFDPFFTTKDPGGGTGLGLAVAYGIIHQHEGWIAADSTPGKGSTFDVYLPPVDAPVIEPADERSEEMPSGTETILVVDDEEMVRGLAKEVLERAGYSVVEADSGMAAIEAVGDPEADIDVVLLDVVMPRMSGRETLAKLREIRPGLPVVLASGFTQEDYRAMLAQGAHSFLQKPYDRVALARAIRNALDAAGKQ